MTDTKHKLRLMGFAVTTTDGHIQYDGREDEKTAVLRLELERDTSHGRDLIDKLIEAADSPRALLGRSKSGSAVLLFRHGRNSPAPHINGQSGSTFKLATRDGAVRLTITVASYGTLEVSAYSWDRSPLDNGLWTLPVLTSSIGEVVIEAAFTAGCSWAEQVDDELKDAQRRADIASGKIVLESDEARQAREDDALVARYEGQPLGMFDDARALVRAARFRVAERRKAEAALASTAA